MNIPFYDPNLLISPERWLLAAVALVLMCLRAYVGWGDTGPLLPIWWRITLRLFAPAMRRLDRVGRKGADLTFRAVVLIVVGVMFSALAARGIDGVDQQVAIPGLVSVCVLMVTMSSGSIWRVMRRTSNMNDETLLQSPEARQIFRTYNLATLNDAATVRRVMIGHAAMGVDKMCLLPIIWFLLFGIAGAMIAATLAALLWQAKLTPPHSAFGETLMAIEKLLGFIPNWLAGVFFSLSTLVAPRAGILRTVTGLNPEQPRVKYESGGYALAALAWGLRITLGGPMVARDGTPLSWAWVGPGGSTAQITATHLKLALYWLMVTTLMIIAALLSAAMWSRLL